MSKQPSVPSPAFRNKKEKKKAALDTSAGQAVELETQSTVFGHIFWTKIIQLSKCHGEQQLNGRGINKGGTGSKQSQGKYFPSNT